MPATTSSRTIPRPPRQPVVDQADGKRLKDVKHPEQDHSQPHSINIQGATGQGDELAHDFVNNDDRRIRLLQNGFRRDR